jgi:hypothetical protein
VSEGELDAVLARYEARSDEFATLVRTLISQVREARKDASKAYGELGRAEHRLRQIRSITEPTP